MSKKLNIIEAMKMPEDTEFKVVYKDGGTRPYNMFKKCDGFFDEVGAIFCTINIVNATFIPIQQPVSFTEAITSGKRIKVDVTELNEKYKDGQWIVLNSYWNNVYFSVDQILKMFSEGNTYRNEIILEGKWYIEESEEQN